MYLSSISAPFCTFTLTKCFTFSFTFLRPVPPSFILFCFFPLPSSPSLVFCFLNPFFPPKDFDPRFPPPPRSRGADFDGFGMGRGPPSHDFDRRPPFAGDQRFSRGPPAPLHQPPPPQPPQSFQDGRDPFGRDLPRRNAPSGHQEVRNDRTQNGKNVEKRRDS